VQVQQLVIITKVIAISDLDGTSATITNTKIPKKNERSGVSCYSSLDNNLFYP
jgi:hypothetical protein